MTGVGMAVAQAGIVVAVATSLKRASGSFSASWMTEAGRTVESAAMSLWKAVLASSDVM